MLDWLPAASLAGIDLLYPDPWPKKRHWKRRFVSRANLDRFARVLRPGGRFRFASDIDSYVNWTLLALPGPPGLRLARIGRRRLAHALSRLARHPLRGQSDPRRPHAGISDVCPQMTVAHAG